MMNTAAQMSRAKEARSEVKARVRRFFLRLMEELDKDTEDFYERVMEQVAREQHLSN
jgi:hypothetical protein